MPDRPLEGLSSANAFFTWKYGPTPQNIRAKPVNPRQLVRRRFLCIHPFCTVLVLHENTRCTPHAQQEAKLRAYREQKRGEKMWCRWAGFEVMCGPVLQPDAVDSLLFFGGGWQ